MTHNQAGSGCYYCCGKCRIASDDFDRDDIAPRWANPLFGNTWTIDSDNLYAAADVERYVRWSSTTAILFYSRVLHFDVQCATNQGTFEVQLANTAFFGFQFGTGSEVIFSAGGTYRWHLPLSLSTSTWYRLKFTISAISASFYECTIAIDGVDIGTFRHVGFGSSTSFLNVTFRNRRTFTRTAGNVVDTYTPGGATTGALSQTRIRRICLNNLQLPSWVTGTQPAARRICDAQVNDLDITNGLAATVELTISGAAESTLNDTFTLSHVAGVWQAGFLDTAYPFTYSGTDYCVRQLIAAFEYESVKYTVVIGRVGQPFTNFTIVFRDDTQPTALPFSRDYADMEYIHHTGGSTAMFNAIIGTGIDFAIAVP